ncbi:hypothetical protein LIER_43261 [Lithospermum erythrorhizon]|uniref:Uncharacterized protein n=1 Tax=Lithospermum erythrorhizon TaxID=34254 RepID=A0AAV3PSU1_LITER
MVKVRNPFVVLDQIEKESESGEKRGEESVKDSSQKDVQSSAKTAHDSIIQQAKLNVQQRKSSRARGKDPLPFR